MSEFQRPNPVPSAYALNMQDNEREQELLDFQSTVARAIGPFADMARLLSPVDPRGTVIERGDKVLEVRHFHNLKALFEALTQTEGANAADANFKPPLKL